MILTRSFSRISQVAVSLSVLAAFTAIAALLSVGVVAQQGLNFDDVDETRQALEEAVAERQQARARSERLEAEADEAEDAAEQAARQAAALASRIQQAEAGIAAAEARISIIETERTRLRDLLGAEQEPLVQLTAALQNFARRPAALSVLRPGAVKDVVYLRAALSTAIPEVQNRTAKLRTQLDRSRQLRREAEQARSVLLAEEQQLAGRREELAQLEAQQRLASRTASGEASREAERALAMGEQARDLDALVGELDRAGQLRGRLAGLDGPRLRPAGSAGAQSQTLAPVPTPNLGPSATTNSNTPPSPFVLPVAGRVVIGFGAPQAAGLSQGLTLAPREGAQIVAPAAGRVAFAGPYRGYGQIVIIEHDGRWTSLVTGLARSDVSVGDELVGGSPLGIAGSGRPVVTLELRRSGEPVNPLPFVE